MPIYEYQCSHCGHQLEAFQKISEGPLKTCPACHSETLNKLISATSFQLKGTGWYATDFRNKGKPPEAKKDADTSESKPETKSSETKSSETKSSEGTSSSTDKS